MNLRALDLNLLVIFHALMTERHVTRAAMKIPMSQPAMSNALARLRYLFKDELFIRSTRGMEPTPRALELGEAVHQILRQTERLMSSDLSFDAATAQRSFTARMSDLVGYLVLPDLIRKIRSDAPGIKLDVLHMAPERTVKALEADQLDFALSMELKHSTSIQTQPMFKDRMVCVMRSGHPLAKKKRLALDNFLQAEQAKVAMSPTDIRFVDGVLMDQGLERKIVVTVPHWLLLPEVLGKTDVIAVISSKLAARLPRDALVTRALPFDSPDFHWSLYWHRRHDNSIPQQWIRSVVAETCRDI
ncbi:MAG: LysR family transcriptional regulator [Paucimonas sp.]|nr:LysR family transcriptional regulator [Paucimonas sp.]